MRVAIAAVLVSVSLLGPTMRLRPNLPGPNFLGKLDASSSAYSDMSRYQTQAEQVATMEMKRHY